MSQYLENGTRYDGTRYDENDEIRRKLPLTTIIGSCIWAFDWHKVDDLGGLDNLELNGGQPPLLQILKLAQLRLYTTLRHDVWF